MGCATYFLLLSWLSGIAFFFCGFIVQPREQAPLFFGVGTILIVIASILTSVSIESSKKKAIEARRKKLNSQMALEEAQKKLAHLVGLEKYHAIDVDDARKYKESVEAMRKLGVAIEQSVYQEKEGDWAIMGGIAEGIAGPAAGASAAINTMQDNARIRIENEARREWGARQNKYYQSMANQAEKETPTVYSMEQLKNMFDAVMSWSPETLMSFITIENQSIMKDNETGAITVSADWAQDDDSLCIDGALRAKLYTSNGTCAGCAYLVFPKLGTLCLKGNFSGICAVPVPSDTYTVTFEPVDLWEFASKGSPKHIKDDQLSLEQHKKIVSDFEEKFRNEVGNMNESS